MILKSNLSTTKTERLSSKLFPLFNGLSLAQLSNFLSITVFLYEDYWRIPLSTKLLSGGLWNLETELEFLFHWIPTQNGLSILDAGTSTGLYARSIVEYRTQKNLQTQMIAIDLSPKFIQAAQSKTKPETNSQIEWLIADLRALPFETHTFDVVVSGGTYNELSLPQKCLSELYRILKPGGRFISMHLLPATSFLGKTIQFFCKPFGIHIHPQKYMIAEFQTLGFEVLSTNEAYSIGMIACQK
ncbi:MAG: class I SAM-dependent methyltransferase [Bacteroidia bacterium]|nr:class I SAM-dependent methyltransferase [Bacteroidia bacterium]